MAEDPTSTAKPPKDGVRETLDTIVTVVVVVLLLRTYVAEAFMIPTGSMATTLYGYQKNVTCPHCGFEFPLNCSREREPQEGQPPTHVSGGTCPNCRYQIVFSTENGNPPCVSGDRVLVAKYLYDWTAPQRLDVVVFKNPKSPQVKYDPLNYIKRLVGLPGETIAIYGGDLYVSTKVTFEDQLPVPADPKDSWKREYSKVPPGDHSKALELIKEKFEIIQKPPSKVLAMMRPVYDNDYPASDLKKYPQRWAAEGTLTDDASDDFRMRREDGEQEKAWVEADEHGFKHAARTGTMAWLRYRHLVVERSAEFKPEPSEVRPLLITDFLGYDAPLESFRNPLMVSRTPPPHWVGDLILETDATVEKAEGQLVLEVARGVDRFQARFDLVSGECSLVRIAEGKEETLQSKPTSLKAAGTYRLRFANVDERLLVWVNGQLPFGDGVSYSAPKTPGPHANDLRPASIGVQGASLQVLHLKLWRDTYYTHAVEEGRDYTRDYEGEVKDWGDPSQWEPLRDLKVGMYYIHPGHYFCLGDNSPESSDSRAWGLVPDRLMLGRALLTYYPFSRMGRIR